MDMELKCDLVFPGCEGEMHAASEEELLALAAEHARGAHGLEVIDEQTLAKVQAAITASEG